VVKMKALSKQYETGVSSRMQYVFRAQEAARLTIPSLFPPLGHNGSTPLPTPYQGLGSRGLKNLSSKLLLALLPPNAPFFRMTISDKELQDVAGADKNARTKFEEALSKYEKEIMTEIETTGIRVACFEVLKQLILAGNALVYLPDEGGMKTYKLDRYIVKRDPMGNAFQIIIKETVLKELLDDEVKVVCEVDNASSETKHEAIDLYTNVIRQGDKWVVYQELNDVKVPGSDGTYPLESSPWLALRFTAISNEDYGRGFVEEHYGDLKSHEGLSKAIVRGSAIMSKILFLVDPNGTTRAKTLTNSESGDVLQGRAVDVSTVQADKQADYSITFQTLQTITERLSFAFMLNAAVQRNAERVTAEEIRYVAGELEDALGGVYSTLSQEFQLPLVNRLVSRMTYKGLLPHLPAGMVKPTITTGLEALGRGHDLNRLKNFLNDLAPLGPEEINKRLNVSDYIDRVGVASGVDTTGLIRTDEEVKQAEQQQQLQQLIHQVGPQAASKLIPNIDQQQGK